MIARVWHGYTKPEHADAYEAMLKPQLLPGSAKPPVTAAATCSAETLIAKSSSLPSCCGTRWTQFAPLRDLTTRPPSFPKSAASTYPAMTKKPPTTKLLRRTGCPGPDLMSVSLQQEAIRLTA